jgi:outer membrane lipoprotein-sorting protein
MRLTRTLAVLALVAAPIAAQTPTLDQVLDKHFEAMGGKDKIAALQTVKLSIKQVFGPQEVPATITWQRPNRIRMEFTLQGMTGVQAYDGKTAWQVMPFLGKNDPEEMTGDDLKDIIENADLVEGPLFNWQEKGHKVEFQGEDTVEGTPAWKLHVVRKDGDEETIWLDKDAYVEIKSESTHTRGDKQIQFESSYGDYKEVQGLLFPFSIAQKVKGSEQGGTITVESIELDPKVDGAVFTMPAKKAADAPTPGGKG